MVNYRYGCWLAAAARPFISVSDLSIKPLLIDGRMDVLYTKISSDLDTSLSTDS
jgi:hypothetical protein